MATWTPDHPRLQLLVELHLQYRKDKARVTAGAPRVGAYLGSGTGKASGLVTGEIERDLFEAQGETVCAANFKGKITAEHGKVVNFDCLGFFRRPAETGQLWTMSGSVLFETADAGLKILTERPAIWEGIFDMTTYSHSYSIYRSETGPQSDKAEDADAKAAR